MVAKPGGLGDKKLVQIGGSNQYGFIEYDDKRVEKAKQRYLAGDSVTSTLKAVYNGEGVNVSDMPNRTLDYGTPSKDKNP